jgi:hypothetical protein
MSGINGILLYLLCNDTVHVSVLPDHHQAIYKTQNKGNTMNITYILLVGSHMFLQLIVKKLFFSSLSYGTMERP